MATLHEKIKLLRGLLTGEVAKTGPFYVDIDLTRRCNLRCLGCPYHSPHINDTSPQNPAVMDISLDFFKRLCNELKGMNTHSLILQGAGEPLLHPDVFEMIATAKAAGFHVTLITNGTLLDRETIEALIAARLDTLKVSLWASSAEQYQQNYPGTHPDSFRKVVDGLKLLASLKAERNSMLPVVQLHHPINSYNFQTIDALVDLALRTGCNGLSFAPFRSFGIGALAPFDLSTDEERLVQLSLFRARRRLKSFPMGHNIDEILLRYKLGSAVWQKLPCYIAWIHARIRVDGAVQPCGSCSVAFGNLYENTLHEVWNGSAIRAFRRRTLTCKGLASISEHCGCNFCCYVGDNMRVHRLFKWFAPLARRSKK
jgi:MoaA/NifB/PqqE/SkfB family radical SAM enzyme